MPKKLNNKKAGFGTLPVFMTAISTILGAILFLRFGYAIANTGFLGTIGIIILGHIITIPTAMAVAEIATNQKVEGGGAYYIISRSFGLNIGAAIGITLYLSQAISIAFYLIAFTESFTSLLSLVPADLVWIINKPSIGIVSLALLAIVMLTKGANVGMKALYLIVGILFLSIGMFLAGEPLIENKEIEFFKTIDEPDSFFSVFTIIFPAFTGLAAGLGLSGDLRDPKRSIPRGTLIATFFGMFVYIIITYKLTVSATLFELNHDPLIMSRIAVWGPIVPIGLACASISSALGSAIVAPRTLQAIGFDNIFPNQTLNLWFAKGKKSNNEPINSSVVTLLIAFVFVAMGNINFVAEIISMFFMVTYGAICLISFLEHLAADPSYRPTFRSKWYLSLLGAVLSVWMMFKMNAPYAILSLAIMSSFYYFITVRNHENKGLANLFRGVVFQLSRQMQIFLQRADKEDIEKHWRPFIICVTEDSFKRRSAFDLLRWVSYKYGFGTYIHYVKGLLNNETNEESKVVMKRLLNLAAGSKNRVYLDTIISPSYTSALAQVVQLSGVSGKGNNLILFEFSRDEPENLTRAFEHFPLLRSTNFDVCILNSSYKGFGYRKEIHIWITSNDYYNANLMILLAYIMLGHPDWRQGTIKIFALFPLLSAEEEEKKLQELIRSGRLPISSNNVTVIVHSGKRVKEAIADHSSDADLTIVGFRDTDTQNPDKFIEYADVGNILFVNSKEQKEIR